MTEKLFSDAYIAIETDMNSKAANKANSTNADSAVVPTSVFIYMVFVQKVSAIKDLRLDHRSMY